jgi:acetate kinase
LRVDDAQGRALHRQAWSDPTLTHEALLGALLDWAMGHLDGRELIGIGHRVVHGGAGFSAPCLVDGAVMAALTALNDLAPLHQPHNLAAIEAMLALRPDLPQVACFDTAFHHAMPALATWLALPRALHDAGVRRYGFHGLSYEFIARQLAVLEPDLARGRVIAAHLGNGASLCAMKAGQSVDTSMGFSALDGLMMGTRCGTLDAGAVLHLMLQRGMGAPEVQDMLYRRSGLLGVSGLSSDMRELSASPAPEAAEAIALFAWRAAREAGALITSLGGLDGIVFTAGIGEHDAAMRARICAHLHWAGVEIDPQANAAHAPVISTPDSAIRIRVIPTDEERMIALHTLSAIKEPAHAPLVDLSGKRGLVVGIANDHSIASGCAEAFRQCGARLGASYLNDKALPFVQPVAERLGVEWLAPCDVRLPGQLEALFEEAHKRWGGLDFVLHSIAFAPREDLHGRVVDSSAEGFAQAMDVSCHSFLRMARLAEPLMTDGGCLLCVTFYGSERVVEHYNLMGPVKAALESATRYVAAELGHKGIRAHAISPAPSPPARPAVSTVSTTCWNARGSRCPRGNWWTCPMSARWPPFWSAPPRAGSPAR